MLRKFLLFVFVMLALQLIACAFSDVPNKAWIGHSMNELNLQRGPPTYVEPRSGGGAIFTYDSQNDGVRKICRETFITDIHFNIEKTDEFKCVKPPVRKVNSK